MAADRARPCTGVIKENAGGDGRATALYGRRASDCHRACLHFPGPGWRTLYPICFKACATAFPSDVFSMALVVATISGDHFPGLVTGRSRSCDGTPSASTFYPAAGSSSAPWLGSIPTAGPGKGSETGLAFRNAGSFKLLSSNSQLDNSHAPDTTAFIPNPKSDGDGCRASRVEDPLLPDDNKIL